MKPSACLALSLLVVPGCKVKDPLYCDENTPCMDPARPFCDLEGEYAASEGIKRTCIPAPSFDAGTTGEDAGTEIRIDSLATSAYASCAVLSDGALRCWGRFGDDLVGDDEHPRERGDLRTGGAIAEVAVGDGFACARYRAGNVRCWGRNSFGQLGYGHTNEVYGHLDSLPDVELGGAASSLVAGAYHACAVLESGNVRCWGWNESGQLGYGHANNIGDNEVPTAEEPVRVGGAVRQLAVGAGHSCAALEGGQLRCWGANFYGQLGYGNTEDRGDDEPLSGLVNVGGDVESVAVGAGHTCVLLDGGGVKCWGATQMLGIPGSTEPVGDNEAPAASGNIELGRAARQIVCGDFGACAVLDNGEVFCWGADNAEGGGLGYPNEYLVGNDETPAEQGPVVVGAAVDRLSTGSGLRNHSCALLDGGAVRCWGENVDAQLGLLHQENIGDDEHPGSEDPVQILD